MQHRKTALALALTAALTAAGAHAQTNALTIYSSARPGSIPPETYRNSIPGQNVPGYALVRVDRPFALERGRNTVRVTDVAALIDPTTVAFESLTDPAGTRVVEQSFQFDLVNSAKLLQKYVDRTIQVDQVRGNAVESFSGTLLSTAGGLVLRRPDGTIQMLPNNAGVTLPDLPGGLITRPTLVWDVAAERAATHATRVSYQTNGIAWWADYNLTYSDGANANACRLDVSAWVSILNQSGASYPDAKVKLVAGDVHRAPRPVPAPRMMDLARAEAVASQKAAGFEEKSFFEYHLYTLGRTTGIPDNSTKQIELFPTARGVPCEKTLVYQGGPGWYQSGSAITDRGYGIESNRKVDTYLNFRNAQENNLGMPLPAGRMRVAKLDSADKTLEFIGEDAIDHTPRNEKVRIKLGSAFDVVGERRQVNFNVDTSRKSMTEEIEVKVRNQKKEAVTVMVKESLYRWVNWTITQKTHEHEKLDARTVQFPVKIEPGKEAVVRYSVNYTW
ncbi:MAG TPA: hypothetical protein VHP37_20970 [Burkholderiales bacterium]|nr:hypothetical protein [Burkholderiales bacterium]